MGDGSMSLHDALGGMKNIPQWFVWRLEWDGVEAKYKKTPCANDGSVFKLDAGDSKNWMRYDDAVSVAALLDVRAASSQGALRYALGFWMTADCGYWFFDIDGCAVDGVLSEFAAGMAACFPGALMEWSSSKRGIHIIGKTAAPIGEHRSRDIHKLHMEFYTEGRGIAFGLDGIAQGNADSCHDAMVATLIGKYFPPRVAGERGDGPRAEWRGPADDDALIAKALAARAGAASVFGGKATFGQLWRGEVELSSEHDMALASHLAFWTGCDEERIERLMRKSGLAREKWNEHRTYLRELTIANACAGCSQVYQEPQRSIAVQTEMYGSGAPVTVQSVGGELITAEQKAQVQALLDAVSACGTVEDMHNLIIPSIRSAGVPGAYQELIVRSVNERLEIWKAKLPVAKVRALLFPPVIAGGKGSEPPLWMQQHVYVKAGDFFYNCADGSELSYQSFRAEYSRLMPMRESGAREDPVEWAFTRWNIATVHHLGYRPDKENLFSWDGYDYANKYNANSVPITATSYTERGIAGIAALQALLWDMCGRRQDVFTALLGWLAHNVQRPGVKVRWSPLIKGTQGDGKSLVAAAVRAAMGYRNVGVTGNTVLTNSGQFDDWKVGSAINFIEEIMLTGKIRYTIYNAMKDCISNDVISVNAKGDKGYKTWNITNHVAFTNHNDAIPLELGDRRWFIVFTPWSSLTEMLTYCGLDAAGWKARTDAVDHAWKHCAGELRAWLLALPLDGFDADGSALMTPEKMQMMASSQEDAESVAESIISEGAHGISRNVISSSCLTNALKVRAMTDGFEVPRTMALNHMLTRMGYSKLPKQLKWRNSTHTIWIKNGFKGDARLELDQLQTQLQTQPTH
jgi:hypothetical protein